MLSKRIKLRSGIAFLLSCVLGLTGQGQDTLVDKFYISAGANFWNDYSINPILAQNGIAPVGLVTPQLAIGEIIEYKKFQYTADFAAFFNSQKNAPVSYRLAGLSIRASFQYNVLSWRAQRFYAGVFLDFTNTNLFLHATDNVVDFRNLNPSGSSGLVHLTNSSGLIGPIVSTGDLFPRSDFSMRLTASYAFNVIHGRWKSFYGQTLNSPKEKAGRFSVGVLFPVF